MVEADALEAFAAEDAEGMEDVEGVEVVGGGGGMPRRKRSRPAESAAKEKEAIKVGRIATAV